MCRMKEALRIGGLVLIVTISFSCLALGKQSGAESLIQRLPDETIGFVATSGGDELKPAFDKAVLGRIWNDPNVQTFVNSIKNEIIGKIKAEISDPNEAKMFNEISSFVSLILKRPLAAGAAVDKSITQGPPLYGFVIVDAGPKLADLTKAISRFESAAPKGDIVDIDIAGQKMRWLAGADGPVFYWGFVGNFLVFGINDKTGLAIKNLKSTTPVSAANYLADLTGNGDAMVMYADMQKIAGIIKTIAEKENGEEDIKTISTVMKSLGLADVKVLKSRMGFSGQEVVSDELIEIPQPRTGIPAAFKPIDMSIFDLADAKSMDAAAWNVDFGGVYDTIMNAIKAASPDKGYPEVIKGIAELESKVSFSIRKDLIGGLSGPMIIYTVPETSLSTIPVSGIVFIVKSANIAGIEKSLKQLCDLAVNESNKNIQVNATQQGGRTYYTIAALPIAAMQILPTWTVAGDYLIVAMNQPLCIKAAERIAAVNRSSDSLRTTAGFKKATTGIKGEILYLNYIDSRAEFIQGLKVAQQLWPTLALLAARGGVRLPIMMPSLDYLADQLGVSVEYGFYNSRGLHSKYRGSGMEASLTTTVAGGALGMSILMPALAKARQQAQRIVSATNIKRIMIGLIIYADEHENKFPASLNEEFMKYTGIQSKEDFKKLLESPLKPKDFDGPSYIYVPIERADMPGPSEIIVVYENPEFCRDGVNVGFIDGHVEFMKPQDFIKTLTQTYKRLGKPMPQIKFGR